ncbi:magnesium-protoporphyrin IX monomethyl ester cyclase [Deltaproteobacteria bacterium]|nr:magnesium-protoporphyrin IX monomethyl ester cyclase [Deltaproteobacteria bacterium]
MTIVFFNPRAQKAHRRLPLSLLMVARGLPPDARWTLVDGNVEANALDRLRALCARGRVLLLVTVMPGPQLRVAVPICRELKARNPELFVVWGGYFPSVHPEAVARDPGVDLVAIGQGEATVAEVLAALEAGADPLVSGTAAWRGGALVKGAPRANQASSAWGPVPYARVDMERYAARTFLGSRTFNHHSSVGCPFLCNFCAVVNLYAGRWLPDPAADVVRSVRQLHDEFGANAVEFHDNNFFAWERRCREVAEGIERCGVAWWGEGRIDTMLGFAGATWEAMARSGLRMVFFGAESGDDEALDRMDKGGLRVADTLALNQLALRHGVVPEFSFVLGNAGDPERDVRKSLELVRRLKHDNPACEIILYLYTPVPLPGQWDEAERLGMKFPTDLDGWLAPPWASFDARRTASTPWMTSALRREIYDFEVVLNARFPTATDRNLAGWQRSLLRYAAAPRWRTGLTRAPWELKLLQRAWAYRRPEEMGF